MSRFAADLPADVVGPQRGTREGRRYGLGYFLHRYARNRLALAGLWVVLGIALVAIFAPWFAPASPIKPDFGNLLQPSTATHPMGTDDLGRDVLSRVIFGTRTALLAGVISVGIAVIAGLPAGLLSGYFGGGGGGFPGRRAERGVFVSFFCPAAARWGGPCGRAGNGGVGDRCGIYPPV